ncbi:MAG TPA: OsmC family protein [Thermoanaerobaculia bacterium]|nr:OsmC family protein [Thermoanaerobaculia bacterium]
MDGVATFSISATWDPSVKEGRLANGDGSFSTMHAGAAALDGKAGVVNPEELLLAGVAACFVQTWAIFVEKLKLPVPAPRVDATCALEKDPAGGFRITRIDLYARVPAGLLEERKGDVDKTLSLAEKYCIVSKAVRGSVVVTASPRAA